MSSYLMSSYLNIMRMFMLLSISMNIYVSCLTLKLTEPMYCPAKNTSCQTIYLPTCPADNIYLAYTPIKNTPTTLVQSTLLSPLLFIIMSTCLLGMFYLVEENEPRQPYTLE